MPTTLEKALLTVEFLKKADETQESSITMLGKTFKSNTDNRKMSNYRGTYCQNIANALTSDNKVNTILSKIIKQQNNNGNDLYNLHIYKI
jgi:hypothetical protein